MEKWKITFKTERSWSNDDFEIAAEAPKPGKQKPGKARQ